MYVSIILLDLLEPDFLEVLRFILFAIDNIVVLIDGIPVLLFPILGMQALRAV